MYYKLLNKSDRLLWASERDGYNHLYPSIWSIYNRAEYQVRSRRGTGKCIWLKQLTKRMSKSGFLPMGFIKMKNPIICT